MSIRVPPSVIYSSFPHLASGEGAGRALERCLPALVADSAAQGHRVLPPGWRGCLAGVGKNMPSFGQKRPL